MQTLQHLINMVLWFSWKKFGSSGNSVVGPDVLSIPFFCVLLGDLWAWLSKQCWGPILCPLTEWISSSPETLSPSVWLSIISLFYCSLAFLLVLHFPLIHHSMWCQIPLKIQTCHFGLPPNLVLLKVIGVCCVFCTYPQDAAKLPLLKKQGFLEGFVQSRWVVSSHHTHT